MGITVAQIRTPFLLHAVQPWRGFAALLASVLLFGCATPAERVHAAAVRYGFHKRTVPGGEFSHVIYINPHFDKSGIVHVYIEGDGLPWETSTRISTDPTPRRPLALELMASDPAPSVYLGRPCYFGLVHEAACTPRAWTDERYAQRVVSSMAAALRHLVNTRANVSFAFIGYSGGGALAVLLAEVVPATRAVVTLAGNLDTEAWTRRHRYTPLYGSLNPAERPALDPHIVQLHYFGARDDNIPVMLARNYLRSLPHVQPQLLDQADHICCWAANFPEILRALRAALDQPSQRGDNSQ
jgi:pimeloyl-ACP methyl ester carboxylesterase